MSQIAGFVIFWSLILSVSTVVSLPVDHTPIQIDQNIQLQETRVPEAFPNYFLPSGSNEFTNLHLQNRESIGGLGLNSTSTTTATTTTNQNQTEFLNCTRSLDNCTEPKRDKERRIEEIRQRVGLLFPGRNVPTVSTSSSAQLIPSLTPVGKIQTFYAQCDLPRLSDASTWTSDEFFHIFFNVSSAFPHTSQNDEENRAQTTPSPLPSSTAKNLFGIPERQPSKYKDLKIRATLKLYKIGFGRNAEEVKYESPEPSQICTDTRQGQEIQINSQDSQSFVTVSNSANSAGDDERIRISVFWYTQHLTSHHYKRKLLDSKSFLAKESKWIEFDISKASRTWIEKNNNNGLVIEVENENEELLDAKQYLSDNYACHALKLSSSNNSKNNSRIDFLHPQKILPPPMLEVCTIEKPIIDDDEQAILTFPFPSSILTSRDEQPIVQGDGEIDIDLGSFTTARSRQHRHGHGNLRRNQRHNKRNRNSTSGSSADNSSASSDGVNSFKLDENHPLRSILLASNPNAQNQQNQQIVNNERGDFSSIRRTPPGVSVGVKGGQAFDLEAFKTLIREVNSQNQNQLRTNGTNNDGQIVIQRIFINPEKLFPSLSTPTTSTPNPTLNEIKSDGKSL